MALLGSLGLLQGARLVFSLVVAAVLSPTDFTRWTLLLAFLTYAPAALLGAGNGMNRLVPMLLGGGRADDARQVESAAWALGGGVTLVLVVGGALLISSGQAAVGAAAVTGSLVCGYQLQQFSLRARLRFGRASMQQAMFGLSVLVAAGGVWLMHDIAWAGAVALYAVAHLLALTTGFLLVGRIALAPQAVLVADVVRSGAPIMLAGLMFGVLTTMDRWIAAALLGARDAAPYAFATVLAAAVLLVPAVVGQQTYPRLARARGQGAVHEDLRSVAASQNRYAGAATLLPVGLVVTAVWVVVPHLLPAYVESRIPLTLLAVGLVGYSFATGWANYLTVVGRQREYLGLQGLAIVIGAPMLLAGTSFAGPAGLATAMATTLLLYSAFLRIAAGRLGPKHEWAAA